MPWEKSMQGSLPPWWVEANGQLLADSESPLNGEYIPNLNNVSKNKTVDVTNASTTVTMATTKDIVAGATIINTTYFTTGTKIISIDSDTTVTVDQAALGTASGVAATVGGNGPVFLGGSSATGIWNPDQMQGHHHDFWVSRTLTGPNGGGSDQLNVASTALNIFNDRIRDAKTDGTNGTPRTGDETLPKHRTVTYVMKVKNTNQTKLITGFTLTGGGYGPTGGVLEVSGNTSVGVTDPQAVNVTTGASDVIISILNESWVTGQRMRIRKVDSGTGKVSFQDTTNGIDGVTTGIDLDSKGDYAELEWTGSEWSLNEYKDHGSNANGEWVRYVDGTMEQRGSETKSVSSSAVSNITISFPVLFLGTDYVITATLNDLVGGAGWNGPYAVGSKTTGSAVLSFIENNNTARTGTLDISYVLSGRWRA